MKLLEVLKKILLFFNISTYRLATDLTSEGNVSDWRLRNFVSLIVAAFIFSIIDNLIDWNLRIPWSTIKVVLASLMMYSLVLDICFNKEIKEKSEIYYEFYGKRWYKFFFCFLFIGFISTCVLLYKLVQ